MSIVVPYIDPVAISVGPLKIHWYGIAYVIGILLAITWGKDLLKKYKFDLPGNFFDDFIPYFVISIIIGGRLGHVIFFEPLRFLENPLEIFMVWKGGMSFHGGAIGVIVAEFYYAKKRNANFYHIADLVALCLPIGLFFGRIANFINVELFGIPTEKPWGVIFYGHSVARHPTQIYEALLEGLVLFLVLNFGYKKNEKVRKIGGFSGCMFLFFYGLFRLFVEQFKVQDSTLRLIDYNIGVGVVLCIIMLLASVLILIMRIRACANLLEKTE